MTEGLSGVFEVQAASLVARSDGGAAVAGWQSVRRCRAFPQPYRAAAVLLVTGGVPTSGGQALVGPHAEGRDA